MTLEKFGPCRAMSGLFITLLSAVFNVSDTKEFENQQLFALNIILTPEGDEHQEVPGSSAAGCS